ncbi:conserved hypothetical protein [Arthrobacter sp. 9V]|nr:conserved hypothetical protein [Arthrobacter sp. 9V]
MIRRLACMGIGVAVGMIACRKVNEAMSALGPKGLNRAVSQVVDEASEFSNVLRTEMRTREIELRAALNVDWTNTQPMVR